MHGSGELLKRVWVEQTFLFSSSFFWMILISATHSLRLYFQSRPWTIFFFALQKAAWRLDSLCEERNFCVIFDSSLYYSCRLLKLYALRTLHFNEPEAREQERKSCRQFMGWSSINMGQVWQVKALFSVNAWLSLLPPSPFPRNQQDHKQYCSPQVVKALSLSLSLSLSLLRKLCAQS